MESRKLWRLERPRHFAVITRGKEIVKRYRSSNLTQDSTLTRSSPPSVILVSPLEQKLNLFLPLTRKRRIRTQKGVFFFSYEGLRNTASLSYYSCRVESEIESCLTLSPIMAPSQILEETDWCLAIGHWLNMEKKLEKITGSQILSFLCLKLEDRRWRLQESPSVNV